MQDTVVQYTAYFMRFNSGYFDSRSEREIKNSQIEYNICIAAFFKTLNQQYFAQWSLLSLVHTQISITN